MNFKKLTLLMLLAALPILKTATMEQGLGKRQPDDHALVTAKKQKPEPNQINWFEFLSNDIKIQILEYLLQSSPRLLAAFQQLSKVAQLDKSFYELANSQDIQKIFEKGNLKNKIKADKSIIEMAINKAPNSLVKFVMGINGFDLSVAIRKGLNVITPLIWLTSNNESNFLQELLKNKEQNRLLHNVNFKDKYGKNAVFYALENNKPDMVKILQDCGAAIDNIIINDSNFLTSLIIAVINNNLEMVSFLLNNKTNLDINFVSNNGTALSLASQLGHLKMAKLLLDNGAEVNKTGIDGRTPLMVAVINGQLEIVKLLIANGANINERRINDQISALMLAAKFGHLDIAQILIENQAELEAKDSNGNTALLFAISNEHLDVVKFLLDKGANINAINNFGSTGIRFAVENGHLDIVKLLIDKGANVKAVTNTGATALLYATTNRHLDIAELLINKGANVNAATNNTRATALTCAAEDGYLDIVKLLIEKGANVNAVTNTGTSALIYAAGNGHLDIAKLLIDKGANVKAVTNTGATALSFAKQYKHYEIVKLLQEYIDKDNEKLELANQPNCAICSDEFAAEQTKSTKVLNCGHKYHKECINSWLKDHNFCPYCKKQQ